MQNKKKTNIIFPGYDTVYVIVNLFDTSCNNRSIYTSFSEGWTYCIHWLINPNTLFAFLKPVNKFPIFKKKSSKINTFILSDFKKYSAVQSLWKRNGISLKKIIFHKNIRIHTLITNDKVIFDDEQANLLPFLAMRI